MPLAPGRPPKKPTNSSAAPYNSSGIYAGGATGSGSATYQPKPKTPKNANEKIVYGVKAKQSGTFQGGVGGSGVMEDRYAVPTEGGKVKYVSTPDPIKGSGGAVPPSYGQAKINAAAAGIDAGSSRSAPGKPGRAPKKVDVPVGDADAGRPAPTAPGDTKPKDPKPKEDKAPTTTTSTSATSSSSGDTKKKTAPAVPGSLNYFMKQTKNDGRGNASNRAYQMFKNYKKSGKLPGDVSSAQK